MCSQCAVKMGAGPDLKAGITVIKGICEYCKVPIQQYLIPWVDFNWPKDKKLDSIAKANRD